MQCRPLHKAFDDHVWKQTSQVLLTWFICPHVNVCKYGESWLICSWMIWKVLLIIN